MIPAVPSAVKRQSLYKTLYLLTPAIFGSLYLFQLRLDFRRVDGVDIILDPLFLVMEIEMRNLMTEDECRLAFIRKAVEKPHIEKDDAFADIGGVWNIRAGKITMEGKVLQLGICFYDHAHQLIKVTLRVCCCIDFLAGETLLDVLPTFIILIDVILLIGRGKLRDPVLELLPVLIHKIGQQIGIFFGRHKVVFLGLGCRTKNAGTDLKKEKYNKGMAHTQIDIGPYNRL